MAAVTVVEKFFKYVTQNRLQATIASVCLSLLPLLGWLGAAIMALVTLRHGPRQGFLILLWMVAASGLLALFGFQEQFIYDALFGSVVVWLLAVVLRLTNAWSQVLQIAMLIGMIAVVIVHLYVPDISAYWLQLFKQYYLDANKLVDIPVPESQLLPIVKQLALMWTGVQASVILLSNIGTLAVARYAQALLYNPGGFKREFLQLRMGFLANVVFIILLGLSLTGVPLAMDLVPVPLLGFFVAGISLIHTLASRSQKQVLLLIIFYGILVVLFQYVLGLVIILALFDSWINIRAYLVKH